MAKSTQARITDEPRSIRDRAIWNRVEKEMIPLEACHEAWGCALYKLHRSGRIGNDEREAGDRYFTLIRDYRAIWRDRMGDIEVHRIPENVSVEHRRDPEARDVMRDVETAMAHILADDLAKESEFTIARAKRISRRYKEARAVVGPINNILEDLLINEI